MSASSRVERGITKSADGRYRARVSFNGKEYERTFTTLEAARSWRRKLVIDLEKVPGGVTYSRRGWVAVAETKFRRETRVFADMDMAWKWQLTTQKALEAETYVDEKTALMTFTQFVDVWRGTKVKAGDRTMMRYEVLLKNQILPYIGTQKFVSISSSEIQDWIAKLKKSGHGAPSVNKAYALVRQIFELAVNRELIVKNPARSVELPTVVEKRKHSLKPDELKALARECGKYKSLVLFLGLTGTRISEALALRVGDIDLKAGAVHVDKAFTLNKSYEVIEGTTKTNQVRSIPISKTLSTVLEPLVEGKDSEAFLFTGANGGPLNYGYFRKTFFAPAVKKLGLKGTTIHTLRHSFATLLMDNQAAVSNVSEMLGHSSTQLTLKTYTHTFSDSKKRDASKLDDIFADATGHDRGKESDDAA
jgi:integrase